MSEIPRFDLAKQVATLGADSLLPPERSRRNRTSKSVKDMDRALLSQEMAVRESQIADAATRLAFDRVGDWLSSKQDKAERFPGSNLAHAKGRAAAYQNAAQEIYGWAILHGEDAYGEES